MDRWRRKVRLSERGTAEVGVVLVALSLLGGVLFGNGIARTTVDILDGVTWLKDEPSGEVVQVNPATGRPQVRLGVGGPGDRLEVQQGGGRLVVLNRTTGKLSSFDLATLLASGERDLGSADHTKVLLGKKHLFVANLTEGTVSALDPLTTDTLGKVWSAGDAGLVDAVIDRSGRVWALRGDGRLVRLTWSDGDLGFAEDRDHKVPGAGDDAVLVPHEHGVTLFGPANGIVYQVGTGNDVSANALRMQGTVAAAASSPSSLVPASSTDTSTVVIVSSGRVREVDVTKVDCTHPGAPAVFRGRVYVPCPESDKVIVLDQSGRKAGSDIRTEGGDQELVVDDGHLLINVPGEEHGVQVMQDGSTEQFTRQDPSLPRRDGRREPERPVAKVVQAIKDQVRHDNREQQDRPDPGSSYRVPGRPPADTGGGTGGSRPDPGGVPGTPAVTARTVVHTDSGKAVMTVSWGAPPTGGAATRYDVSVQLGDKSATSHTGGDSRSAQFTLSCGNADKSTCPGGQATVTASNLAGSGTSSTADATVDYRVPTPTTPPSTPPSTPPPSTPPPSTPPSSPPPSTPPPDPTPSAGATVITSVTGTRRAGATMTLNLAPPSDWAGYSGTCELHHSGNDGGDEVRTIACNTTSAQVVNDNAGEPGVAYPHSAWVTASGPGGTVSSATVSWQLIIQRDPCGTYPQAAQRGAAPQLPQCCDRTTPNCQIP